MVKLGVFGKRKYLEIGLSLFVASLPILPQIWAVVRTPPGYFFVGVNFLANLNDVIGVYFAAIFNFGQGAWLYHNPYDGRLAGIFHYPLYIVLGKIVGLTSLPIPFVYFLAVFVFTFILLIFIFRFLEIFFADWKRRLLAFGLISLGGLYFINVPEGVGLFSFYTPHFVLAQLGLFLCFCMLLKIREKISVRRFLALFFAGVLVAAIHPWMLLVVIAVWGIWLALLLVEEGLSAADIWSVFITFFVLIAASLPFLVYYRLNIPWVSFKLSSSPFLLILLYGPMFFAAVFGFLRVVGSYRKDRTLLFVACWFLVQIAFVYLPFAFQRRFIEGFYFPLAILAVFGMDNFIEKFRLVKVINHIYIYGFFYLSLGLVASYFYSFWWIPNKYVYRRVEEREAVRFLAVNSKVGEKVLALASTGVYIAAETNLAVFVGHGIQTPNFEEKVVRASDFYGGKLNGEKRQEFLMDGNICYVYVGPEEKKDAKYFNESYLDRIYENARVVIYKTSRCN